MPRWALMHSQTGKATAEQLATPRPTAGEKDWRLEFATFENLILANTLGNHKSSRKWTWHAPNGIHHNQIDWIMIPQCFKSGIKQAFKANPSRGKHWKQP